MKDARRAWVNAALCICVSLLMILPVGMSHAEREEMHSVSPLENNLVPNPSFENGSMAPDGWQHNFVCGDTQYFWDSQYVHDGKKSIGIANVDRECNVDTYYWNMRGYIEIDPARSYNLSVWYFYSKIPGTWPRAYVTIWCYDESKTYTSMLDMPCNATSEGWHYFAANEIVLPENTAYVRLVLGAHAYDDNLTSVEIRFDEAYFGMAANETENTPPEAPAITGPTSGKRGEEYTYTFVATDPDEDDIYYWIEWGDTSSGGGWYGPYASGAQVTFTHTWEDEGTYMVKSMVRDTHNAESPWATLEVSIPKTYRLPTIFERLAGMLQHLTGYTVEEMQWLQSACM